jgi:hypothetical protein
MEKLKKYLPHLLAVLGFVLVAIIYFYPVFQNQKIFQSDIVQYTGMAKEQNDFRAKYDEEPYWTNSAFGGMPTYQLGAQYPYHFIKKIDGLIRFLPRPADYLFLYFISFYVLLLVLKVKPLQAFFGSLAFGLSTYLIIIIGVGHNAKAHAIGYMPLVVAGVLLVFQRKYILGGILSVLAISLEIQANHFQMTYYLLFLLFFIFIFYVVKYIKYKEYNSLIKSCGILLVAGIIALGNNAGNLLATSEYTKFSTRGSNELTQNPDGCKVLSKSGMNYDYITEYSYGIAESFNLIFPRMFGGGNSEKLPKESNVYNFVLGIGAPEDQAREMSNNAPTYWGDQPIVAAPAYIGAVVFFFFILALFIEKRKIKYVFLAGAIVSLLFSWGKNFPILTNFFIDYFPLYNKFRAVSSFQVILELCMPVLATLGIYSFFKTEKSNQWKALWQSSAVFGGILLLVFILKSTFNFNGGSDPEIIKAYQEMGQPFVDALKKDRMALYNNDIYRAFALILLVFGVLFFYIKEKLNATTSTIIIGLVMVFDLFFMAKNYVDKDDFVPAYQVDEPFAATEIDMQIKQDTSHYRVLEAMPHIQYPAGALNSARASYFHKSLGGYSAVKPQRIQQMYDYHLLNENLKVLNMFNVKYIIQQNDEGKEMVFVNPDALGNAWFVKDVKIANNADDEINGLKNLDFKNKAIVSKEFSKELNVKTFVKDSLAKITLTTYKPNYLKYQSKNSNNGLAIFSENYYGSGWNAYIDGQKTNHIRANYILRAIQIPAGNHIIEFKFEPQIIKTCGIISLISFILMVFGIGFGIFIFYKKEKKYF